MGLDDLNPLTPAGWCKVCVFELTFPPAVQARLIADGRGPRFIMAHLSYRMAHLSYRHGVSRKTPIRHQPKRSPHYDH